MAARNDFAKAEMSATAKVTTACFGDREARDEVAFDRANLPFDAKPDCLLVAPFQYGSAQKVIRVVRRFRRVLR